jgi:type IV secretory pathway VirB2 component (pilin)
MRSKTTILIVVVTALALSLAGAEPALAQDSNEFGKNLANWLQSIARPLLPAIAGVMCVAALIRRDFGMTMLLLAIVLAAGLFIWAPGELNEFVKKLAEDLV